MKQLNTVTYPILLNGISIEDFKEIIQGFLTKHPTFDLGIKVGNETITRNSVKEKDLTVYLTRGEVAKQLQISLPTLHNYSKEGFIKSYRIGGKVRFKAEDIEKALTERNFMAVNRKGGLNA